MKYTFALLIMLCSVSLQAQNGPDTTATGVYYNPEHDETWCLHRTGPNSVAVWYALHDAPMQLQRTVRLGPCTTEMGWGKCPLLWHRDSRTDTMEYNEWEGRWLQTNGQDVAPIIGGAENGCIAQSHVQAVEAALKNWSQREWIFTDETTHEQMRIEWTPAGLVMMYHADSSKPWLRLVTENVAGSLTQWNVAFLPSGPRYGLTFNFPHYIQQASISCRNPNGHVQEFTLPSLY